MIESVQTAKKHWELPSAQYRIFSQKKNKTCIVIPVLNEGSRIIEQLEGMKKLFLPADVIICDGGSTDGCTDDEKMIPLQVRGVIEKTGPGKMSAQLRLAMAFAVEEGYDFIINIDGNNKDGYESIPKYIERLESGVDIVLPSRFIEGGRSEFTPLFRSIAIKLIHAPLISIAAGARYTDTTNSFRGYRRNIFLDLRIRPFRNIFSIYNLPYYLAVRSTRLGYRVEEIAVRRSYPESGEVPTKIKGIKGKLGILKELACVVLGFYNPK
jgi:dolichol-phosphate mannosyltransferase